MGGGWDLGGGDWEVKGIGQVILYFKIQDIFKIFVFPYLVN